MDVRGIHGRYEDRFCFCTSRISIGVRGAGGGGRGYSPNRGTFWQNSGKRGRVVGKKGKILIQRCIIFSGGGMFSQEMGKK